MDYMENMDQGYLGEGADQQAGDQPDVPNEAQSLEDAAGSTADGFSSAEGDSAPEGGDTDTSESGKEDNQDGSADDAQPGKPKRKSRSKKKADATEGEEGDTVPGDEDQAPDADAGLTDPPAGDDAPGLQEGDTGDEGADADGPDGALPENPGEGDVDGEAPPDGGGLPPEWPPEDSLPEGFTPEDGTPLEVPDENGFYTDGSRADDGDPQEGDNAAAQSGPEAADVAPTGERPARPARRRQAASRRPAVLDASGNVIYDRTDSGQHDMSVLTAARNSRRILTATVDGIETDGEALPRVVFYHGTVKVMIPFSQMGFDLDPETVSQREARLLIDSMLGATIDYMVRGVDTEARVAGASRRDAMLLRQRTILNARGNNSDYRINEGMRVMARVIHVSRNTVRVEVYGFESYVRIDSISNLWVNDVREVIQVGEERPVEIVSMRRDDAGRVTSMRVSMKAAEDAPQLELREGNTYTGTISNFSETAYYVRVAGIPVEVRCPIKSNHAMELINQGDYVKFYIRGIHDGVPTGAILKIIKKKLAPGF